MRKFLLYWNTVKYLRIIQIYYRIRLYIFPKTLSASNIDLKQKILPQYKFPCRCHSSLISKNEFNFFGEKGDISSIGWNGPQRNKLWRYNQHYFDDLNSNNNSERTSWHISLLEDWMEKNSFENSIGWDPYPTSLRIVNIIKWILNRKYNSLELSRSLYLQTRWLFKNIEYHILGNHIFSNAKALIFAGIFFDSIEAKDWLKKGKDILSHELSEQILRDGGHFERSPMYHSLFLEDLLDIYYMLHNSDLQYSSFDHKLLKRLSHHIRKMFKWLSSMCHPDGDISFFNDSALKVAPKLSNLIKYASEINIYIDIDDHSSWLKESGYVRLENKFATVIIDIAPVGADYIPGHAHADTLSFELSLNDKRILVNSGISTYESNEMRYFQRGTTAHNTLSIDENNSSEVWSSFRLADRAQPINPKVYFNESYSSVNCSHNGFRKLKNSPTHNRKWIMNKSKLVIKDFLDVHSSNSKAYFHFHPDNIIKVLNENMFKIYSYDKNYDFIVINGNATLKNKCWYPEFGLSVPNYCIEVSLINGKSEISINW